MVALVTGFTGLISAEAVRLFAAKGMDVIGVDNDMRAYSFGPDASTNWSRGQLEKQVRSYHHEHIDIRDLEGLKSIFQRYGQSIKSVLQLSLLMIGRLGTH